MPDLVRSCEMRANSSKVGIGRRKLVSYPKLVDIWESSNPWKQKWISDTSPAWDRRMNGFREHIASYGSQKGVSERHVTCGWAVVQLDYDTAEDPWYAISGTVLAKLEGQRTIKKTQLWDFTMTLAVLVGSSTIHTVSMGIVVGLWKEKKDSLGRNRRMLTCGKTVELFTECAEKERDLDVKHMKAHRTEKEKNATSKKQFCSRKK